MGKSKKKGVIWAIVLVIVFAAVVWIIIAKSPQYGVDRIAVIPIKGAISTENGDGDFFRSGTVGSGNIVEFIELANKDKSVKGIILNINSPGGTVVGSKEIVDAVKKVDKPVVALIREVGASGAYWIASASDVIIADPLSVTGSVGVLGSYLEFSDLFSKYGVKYQEITTGEYKDLGNPYSKLTAEERRILLDKLQIIHNYFSQDVSANRGIDLSKQANGLFYLGIEAMDLGMIDKFGGKNEAIAEIKQLAGIEEYQLVFYEKKESIFDILGRLSSSFGFSVGQGMGNAFVKQDEFEISLT